MPRIRTVKPEIWDSPDFMALNANGQLVFLALISLADDAGRLRTDCRHLHLVAVRSVEPAEIDVQLDRMHELGMVQRYEANGRCYVQLSNWTKHQKVDHAKESEHPAPPAGKPREPSRRRAKPRDNSRILATSRENSRALATSHAPADRIEDLGSRIEEGIGGSTAPAAGPASPEEVAEPIRLDVEQLCQRMADSVEQRGERRPAITERWRRDARLILDRDRRPLQEALELVDWLTADQFWRANVLGLPKFREQYPKLKLQRERQTEARPPEDDWQRHSFVLNPDLARGAQ